jgi:ribonuclease HI
MFAGIDTSWLATIAKIKPVLQACLRRVRAPDGMFKFMQKKYTEIKLVIIDTSAFNVETLSAQGVVILHPDILLPDWLDLLNAFTQIFGAITYSINDDTFARVGIVDRHVVYTDGACSGNGKANAVAGYSAYFHKGYTQCFVAYGRCDEKIPVTNQRAECLGIITALETILTTGVHADITIVTDSMFWINMINTYMPKWTESKVDFSTKKNPDLTIKLCKIIETIKQRHMRLTLVHVYGHGKKQSEHNYGNAIADKYAVAGKLMNNFILHKINV